MLGGEHQSASPHTCTCTIKPVRCMYGKTGIALEDTLSVAAFTRMAIAWKFHGDFSLP